MRFCENSVVLRVFENPFKRVLRGNNCLSSAIRFQASAVDFNCVGMRVTREATHKIRRIPSQNDRAIIANRETFGDVFVKRNRVKKITRDIAVSDLLDHYGLISLIVNFMLTREASAATADRKSPACKHAPSILVSRSDAPAAKLDPSYP